MTYDLFHQLLYIRNFYNNEADFLKKLEHMSGEEISQYFTMIQEKPLDQTAQGPNYKEHAQKQPEMENNLLSISG